MAVIRGCANELTNTKALPIPHHSSRPSSIIWSIKKWAKGRPLSGRSQRTVLFAQCSPLSREAMNANYQHQDSSFRSTVCAVHFMLFVIHSCCVESLHQRGQAPWPSKCFINTHNQIVAPSRKSARLGFASKSLFGDSCNKKRHSKYSRSFSFDKNYEMQNQNGQLNEQTDHYHLTILIPAYNERYRIGDTLSTYMNHLGQTPVFQHDRLSAGGEDGVCLGAITSGSVSIMVVDDGSNDGTADYVRGKSWESNPTLEGSSTENCWKVDGNVVCISLPENAGKGAAIERGMVELQPSRLSPEKHSKSVRSVVLVADADGSGDISCLDNMLRSLEDLLLTAPVARSSTGDTKGSKVSFDLPPALVVGYRQYPQSKSALRSLLSWGFRTCVSLIFLGTNLDVRDTQCGFKLMTTSAGKLLYRELNLRKWTHDVEVVHRARLLGHRVGECGVPWVDKEGSKLVDKASDAAVVSMVMLGEIAKMRVCYALGTWKVPGVGK